MGRRESNHHGVLLCNKPVRITSHDAVSIVRRVANTQAVGHTGTLDPLAEGLLVICIGRATKIAKHLTGLDKTYYAEVTLGLASQTYDSEGLDPNGVPNDLADLTFEKVKEVILRYVGTQKQKVPIYSAVRVDGERLYKKARQGRASDRPEREITIHSITDIHFSGNKVTFTVSCTSGTYIRTLADDIGRDLGCGGYLSGLKRSKVGDFSIDDSTDVMAIKELGADESFGELLLTVEDALPLGAITVSEVFADKVIHGCKLSRDHITSLSGNFVFGDHIYLKSPQGRLLAVGRACFASTDVIPPETDKLFAYDRVLN